MATKNVNKILIRIDGTSSEISTTMNQPIQINPKSSIALQNLSIDVENGEYILLNTDMNISCRFYSDTNQAVAPVILTIPKGKYHRDDLSQYINENINRTLYFLQANQIPYAQQQGGEFLCSIVKEPDGKAYFQLSYYARVNKQDSFEPTNNVMTSDKQGGNDIYTNLYNANLLGVDLGLAPLVAGQYDGFDITYNSSINRYLYWGRGSSRIRYTDNCVDGSGTIVGLISTSDIDPSDAFNTLKNVSYGIANFYGHTYGNADPHFQIDPTVSQYAVKKSKTSDWELSGVPVNFDSPLEILLGKISTETPAPGEHDYRVYNCYLNLSGISPSPGVDPNDVIPCLDNYTYGDYAMLIGAYDSNKTNPVQPLIYNVQWTQSLIEQVNPIPYMNGLNYGLDYSQDRDYSLRLIFDKISDAELLGFENLIISSGRHRNSTANSLPFPFVIKAENTLSSLNAFPSSILLSSNIPTYSYVNGDEFYSIASIPVDKTQTDNLVYNASPLVDLSIKNSNVLTLSNIKLRLTDRDNQLLDSIVSCTVCLVLFNNEQ